MYFFRIIIIRFENASKLQLNKIIYLSAAALQIQYYKFRSVPANTNCNNKGDLECMHPLRFNVQSCLFFLVFSRNTRGKQTIWQRWRTCWKPSEIPLPASDSRRSILTRFPHPNWCTPLVIDIFEIFSWSSQGLAVTFFWNSFSAGSVKRSA